MKNKTKNKNIERNREKIEIEKLKEKYQTFGRDISHLITKYKNSRVSSYKIYIQL